MGISLYPLETLMGTEDCWLRGYAHKCGGRITGQHLINRAKIPLNLRKKDRELGYLVDSLMVPVCMAHNSGSKMADSSEARAILLDRLLKVRPLQTRMTFNQLHQKLKVPMPEMTIDAILSYYPYSGHPDEARKPQGLYMA